MTHAISDEAKKILIIDDDDRLQGALKDFLAPNGYEVHSMTSGKAVRERTDLYKPDLVILDVMLPSEDGFSVLRRIRTSSLVPVIMLTARGEDTDRIVGLEMGADDYLPKPFNPRELLARIRAVLRRSDQAKNDPDSVEREGRDASAGYSPGDAYSLGSIEQGIYVLDARRQAISRGGEWLPLSTAEFCILRAFLSHPNKVLERELLMQLSFGKDGTANTRNIDVYISRLRGMLRQLGEQSVRIRTVWGAGYCWIGDD